MTSPCSQHQHLKDQAEAALRLPRTRTSSATRAPDEIRTAASISGFCSMERWHPISLLCHIVAMWLGNCKERHPTQNQPLLVLCGALTLRSFGPQDLRRTCMANPLVLEVACGFGKVVAPTRVTKPCISFPEHPKALQSFSRWTQCKGSGNLYCINGLTYAELAGPCSRGAGSSIVRASVGTCLYAACSD